MNQHQNHYEVLGLSRKATKEEIKAAFRRLALQYHPDKHSQSSNFVRDQATLFFKRITEAHDVLSDDQKRAHYDFTSSSSFNQRYNHHRGSAGYAHSYNHAAANSNSYYYYKPPSAASGSTLQFFLRFISTRAFLLNAGFACALLGASVILDVGKEALWKMLNSGKSFEEAIESINKAKAQKDEG